MATVDITRIASNIGALNALNSLQNINTKLATHQTRLSTGKRINSAADDPAGLTIATKMLARSEGLKVTLDNIGDSKNMLSVAEGGLSKMTDIITQMRNKAEQAASDTLGSSERATIQTQLSSYAQQLQDIMDQTKWNGVKLLDNSTGAKTFQTGVDEGETTVWNLPNSLDPATLNLSKVVATAQTTNSVVGTSYTAAGATQSGTLNGMSELATGDYSFEVLDSGYDTVGAAAASKANLDTTSKLVTGVKSVGGSATAASTDAMVSGHYKLTIDAATDATHTSYTVTNLDDNSWGNNGSIAVTGADISAGDLLDAAGGATLGAKIGFTSDPAGMIKGQSMTFEFIKSGDVKLEMNDSSGQATQIARKNADFATSGKYYSATSAYVGAGTAYQSGRGVSVTSAAIANVSSTVGNKNVFTYEQANNFSVDVSNSAKAGKYMTTANNALDKVTSALSDLGSLMARLTFKEDSISVAQVNVEAGYSRIMNANMAEEQMNASKFSILQQTGIAMLAQANQAPQNLLSLFR
jgi:flagellin